MDSVPKTSNTAKKIFKDYNCEIIGVDDTGVGGAVTDILTNDNFSVYPFIAAGKSTQENDYINVKAQAYFELSKAFRKQEIELPNDPLIDQLKADLLNLKYKIDTKGRLQIVSKEDMKKKGVKSPDFAEAFMIAYFVANNGVDISKALKHNIFDVSSELTNYTDIGIDDYVDEVY